jgi:hypothetical protein
MNMQKPNPPHKPVIKRNVLLLSLSVNNWVVPSTTIGTISNVARVNRSIL